MPYRTTHTLCVHVGASTQPTQPLNPNLVTTNHNDAAAQGMIMDAYRVLNSPTPGTILSGKKRRIVVVNACLRVFFTCVYVVVRPAAGRQGKGRGGANVSSPPSTC